MKIKAIELIQNGYKIYLCGLNAKVLCKISSTSIEDIKNDNDVYQRRLDDERRKRITAFSDRTRALFPTAIVLNSKFDIKYSDEMIEINEDKDSYFIIDGQHRIYGISESENDYALPVVIVKVDKDLQSELFITINSEHKAVNPNVRFNMKSNDNVGTPEKEIRNIAVLLNGDENSPFYCKIWLDDKPRSKENVRLSLAAFCEPLCNYIYNAKYYYEFKDLLAITDFNEEKIKDYGKIHKFDKKILWNCYINKRMDVVHKILLNYFNAVKAVYKDEWMDPKSIMLKTVGFNAFILFFEDIYNLCHKNNNNFSKGFLYEILYRNRIDSEFFYISKKASLGKVGAADLYRELRRNFQETLMDYEKLEFIVDDEDFESFSLN